jgi:integrase
MASSYTVRRGDTYHFRLRVPDELVAVMGRRELHSSLGHTKRKTAANRASFLAFHSHDFFRKVRGLMQTMTPEQIAVLVADWRRKMFDRDGEIRRLIELDEHDSHDIQSYEENCEAISLMAEDVLEALVPTRQGDSEVHSPSRREQQTALAIAKEMMATDEPNSDHVPLITPQAFDALDPMTAKDLARQYLLAVSEVYGRKRSLGRDTFATVLHRASVGHSKGPHTAATVPLIAPATTDVAQTTLTAEPSGPTISEAWATYCARQAKISAAWKRGVPDVPRKAWPLFAAVMGADTHVSEMTIAKVRRYESVVEQMPNMRRKPYSTYELPRLIGMAEAGKIPPEDRRDSWTITQATTAILGFLKFCAGEYALPTLAALTFATEGKPQAEDGSDDAGYDAWAEDDIVRMFDPSSLGNYTRQRRTNALRRVSATTPYPDGRQWADFPWFLLVALYTGARRSELLGLTVDDICPAHPETRAAAGGDVPVIYIRPNAERGLKNKSSKRCVPIHPDLVAMGLLDLAVQRKARGDARLLCSAPTMQKATTWLTDGFRDYTIKGLDVRGDDRKVFHSFRHTFKTQAAGVMPREHMNAITGHKHDDDAPVTYEHALQVPQHERAVSMAKMRFPVDVKGIKAMLCGLMQGER